MRAPMRNSASAHEDDMTFSLDTPSTASLKAEAKALRAELRAIEPNDLAERAAASKRATDVLNVEHALFGTSLRVVRDARRGAS